MKNAMIVAAAAAASVAAVDPDAAGIAAVPYFVAGPLVRRATTTTEFATGSVVTVTAFITSTARPDDASDYSSYSSNSLDGYCLSTLSVIYDAVPTLPDAIESYVETAKSVPCPFTPPASLSSVWASYTLAVLPWSSSYGSALTSILSQCTDIVTVDLIGRECDLDGTSRKTTTTSTTGSAVQSVTATTSTGTGTGTGTSTASGSRRTSGSATETGTASTTGSAASSASTTASTNAGAKQAVTGGVLVGILGMVVWLF